MAFAIGPVANLRLFNIVIMGYRTLSEERIVNANWSEDKITRELYIRIYSHAVRNQIHEIPVHQYPLFPRTPTIGHPKTIDFVFRKGFEESVYLSFECKIVDHTLTSAKLYVNEGIMRYTTGIYAEEERMGAMIGYLVRSIPQICVDNINTIITAQLTPNERLEKAELISNFESLYKSVHTRLYDGSAIIIYHLFMVFD